MAHRDQARRDIEYTEALNAYECARGRWQHCEHKKAYFSERALAEEFAAYEDATRRMMISRQRAQPA